MDIRKVVKKEIEAYLKSMNLNYFVGGSERFGWATFSSDIDFFISVTNVDMTVMLRHFSNIIRSHECELYNNCGDVQYTVLGGLVHLNFFTSSIMRFDRLRLEHIAVEKILKGNSQLNQIVRNLKITNKVSGKDVYIALKQLVACINQGNFK